MVPKTVGVDDKEEYCLMCERVTRMTFIDGQWICMECCHQARTYQEVKHG